MSLPSFRALGTWSLLTFAVVTWCLTGYELWKTSGVLFAVDLLCATLLFAAVCVCTWWWRRARRAQSRALLKWCAALLLLGSAALVWTGRPYFAEQILIVRYGIQPVRDNVQGVPLVISRWLTKWGVHPRKTLTWTSQERISEPKLKTSEDLRSAMRLLAVCKPQSFSLFCPQLDDLRPLDQLAELEELALIGELNADTPVPLLLSVRRLFTLGCPLHDFNRVADIAPRVRMLNMSEFQSENAVRINIAGIEKLRHLEDLQLRNIKITGSGVEAALQRIPRVELDGPRN